MTLLSTHGLQAFYGDAQALFGIDCPGCGGLRMMYSLLHGDVPAALHYNAVSFVVVLLCVWSLGAWTVGRLRGNRR